MISRTVFGLAILVAGLSGCAAVSRSASYGMELADAQPVVDGRAYRIYVHPQDETMLIQRPVMTSLGKSFVTGATLHIANPGAAYGPWKQAADAFLAPVGCKATDVYSLGGDTQTWEAKFQCPPGVDLRKLVRDERQSLRAGAPLTLPADKAPAVATQVAAPTQAASPYGPASAPSGVAAKTGPK